MHARQAAAARARRRRHPVRVAPNDRRATLNVRGFANDDLEEIVQAKYDDLERLDIDDLLELPPPPPIYPRVDAPPPVAASARRGGGGGGGDGDGDGSSSDDEYYEVDGSLDREDGVYGDYASDVRRELEDAEHAMQVPFREMRAASYAYRASVLVGESITTTRQRRLTSSEAHAYARIIGNYCTDHCHWLNAYTVTESIKCWSNLNAYAMLRFTLLIVAHGLSSGDAAAEQRYREHLGARCAARHATMREAGMVLSERPYWQYSAGDVFDALVVVAARWRDWVPRSAAEVDEMYALLDDLELHVALGVTFTQLDDAPFFAGCTAEQRARWFPNSTKSPGGDADADGEYQWGNGPEFISEMATMLYTLRQQLRIYEFCVCPSVDQLEPPPPPRDAMMDDDDAAAPIAGLAPGVEEELVARLGRVRVMPVENVCAAVRAPHEYTEALAERVAKLTFARMNDPTGMLEAAQKRMTVFMMRAGEQERYQRHHGGIKTNQLDQVLHMSRWVGESAYWGNKALSLSFETLWYEEPSPKMRTVLLMQMIDTQYRSRSSIYGWCAENVLYDATASGLEAAYDYIAQDRTRLPREQPLIVAAVGTFLVRHRRYCYVTRRAGEAVAYWFWLVDVDALPADVRRLTEAYRALFWRNDAAPLANVDAPPVVAEPPSASDYVMILE